MLEEAENEGSVLESLIGKKIEMFGFEEGVIYIRLDTEEVFMLSIKDEALYVEVYDHGIQ